MRRVLVPIALAVGVLSVSGCDFFRSLAGRPTSSELAAVISNPTEGETPCDSLECSLEDTQESPENTQKSVGTQESAGNAQKSSVGTQKSIKGARKSVGDTEKVAVESQAIAQDSQAAEVASHQKTAEGPQEAIAEQQESIAESQEAVAEPQEATTEPQETVAEPTEQQETTEQTEQTEQQEPTEPQEATTDPQVTIEESDTATLSVLVPETKPIGKVESLDGKYLVLIGTFACEENAKAQAARAKKEGLDVVVFKVRKMTAVAVCPTDDLNEALKHFVNVKGMSFCPPDACIIVVD